MIRFHREGRRQPYIEYEVRYEHEGQIIPWKFNNHKSFLKDIEFLIVTFLQRGAVISKISKKSSQDYLNILKMLIDKYQIRTNETTGRQRRAEALGPDIITLPRISACVPQMTTSMFAKGFGRVIFNKEDDFPNCPQGLFSPMIASVVRKT